MHEALCRKTSNWFDSLNYAVYTVLKHVATNDDYDLKGLMFPSTPIKVNSKTEHAMKVCVIF